MKKNYFLIFPLLFLLILSGCTGYKPIFGSNNLQFEIAQYSIKGEKLIGNKIYSKLHTLSKSNDKNKDIKSLKILIESKKDKESTSKDSTGKILEYRLLVSIKIDVEDYLTENKILNQTFSSSITYKVQDQYSETIKLENRSLENIISKIYQEILIRLSENISNT